MKNKTSIFTSALLLLPLLLGVSCARLKYAFKKEISSPHVWAPLVAAGALRHKHMDDKLSKWAREKNPVFGNQDKAESISDRTNDVLEYEAYATLVLSPTMQGEFTWKNYLATKGKELLTMEAGVRGSYWSTQGIKNVGKRERPLSQDNYSFPSGHATAAGAWKKAATNNLDTFERPYPIIGAVTNALSFTTVWARVEAGKHYPSDVLVGYALGTFITGFVWSATFMPSGESNHSFSVTPMKGGTGLAYVYLF